MAFVRLDTLRTLGKAVSALRAGDVLAFESWRIVLAEGGSWFWLEHDGAIHRVPRDRTAGAAARRLIQGKPNDQQKPARTKSRARR